MAGVGPFSIPAVKKGAFVYSNDLNPESYKWLCENVRLNKVRYSSFYISPFTENMLRSRIKVRSKCTIWMAVHLLSKQSTIFPWSQTEHDFFNISL